MDYLGPRGISLDAWDSWSDYAQSAALEWQRWEAEKCPTGGHHPALWDPEHGGELLEQLDLVERLCPACEYAERRADQQEQDGRPKLPGSYTVWAPLADEGSEDQHPDDHEQHDEAG